ncbi:MAG: hypothetical protein QOK36_1027 [Gaiellales bacterium]|jgi:hypothetical protein|nr:hypothetical protein [Gaiellales bacterium]
MSTPMYPVNVIGGDDLARSRLTVFFRIILVIPHLIVASLWGLVSALATIVAWFAALFTGSVPDGLHAFIASYHRYYTRVLSYLAILADPYPPFGSSGRYPVDLEVAPPVPQSRLTILFRIILVLPCYLLTTYALNPLLWLVAVGNWFVSLFTGRVPEGLQKVGMFCVRFNMRTLGYASLINPRYPAFGETPGSLPADAVSLPPLP